MEDTYQNYYFELAKHAIIKGKDQLAWKFCPVCNKREVCPVNLWKLRALYAGSAVAGGVVGANILPLLGFGTGGVGASTYAASWQSSIGNVTAGSTFATLTSLGMTGLGTLLFGSTSAALQLLASSAVKLNWCTCQKQAEKSKL